MRVLGVDPGLTRCGIGVVDQVRGGKPELVAVGVVRTEPTLPHEQRLLQIEQGITEWIREFHPDVVAVERAFAQHNLMTVAGTIQAAGIAMLVPARANIPVALHTPTEVKAAITGSGRANKQQVAAMVLRILHLDRAPQPADAADAVALALTHLWRGGATNRYAELVAAAKTTPARVISRRK
ncbi:MAG: crossover junction endodeoxyribonuclease RuvC [Propionibacteriaceae bacterium]|jgi:crossover junction endodeoxyribonuclease RuvC|nr:crossover junction endodeoxyribonuclease RuvC [Propionibacteriaceae bacterium]